MKRIVKAIKGAYKNSNLAIMLIGVVSIIFHGQIAEVLPYLLGSVMIVIGVIGTFYGASLIAKKTGKPLVFSYSFVFTILGVLFIAQHNDSIIYIAVAWGVLGLARGGAEIADAMDGLMKKTNRFIALFQALLTIVISVLLLIEPLESISHHIILLGTELIVASLTTFGKKHSHFSLWKLLYLGDEDKKAIDTADTQKPTEKQVD